jgi:hypothetical protein
MKNVSRQSSFCRFSNLSKREATVERLSPTGNEPPAARVRRWFSSSIREGAMREYQKPFADS